MSWKMVKPQIILLFSGKRKSGKDYICEKVRAKLSEDNCTVLRISGPLKGLYAQKHNLKLEELLSDGPYKEKYRTDMILWSDEIRAKDPGYFCKAACDDAEPKSVWIVSDVRRKTDIAWFRQHYGDKIKTIRIVADLETRQSRGYVFTKGVDDVASECDLDDIKDWDLQIANSNNDDLDKSLQTLFNSILSTVL